MEEALGGLLRLCIESRHAYQALKSLATHKTDQSLKTALPVHRHCHQRRRSLVRRTSFNSRLSRVTKSSVACKRACSSRMLA
jgi:hypothetical protein